MSLERSLPALRLWFITCITCMIIAPLLAPLSAPLLGAQAAWAEPRVFELNSLKERWLLGEGAEMWLDDEGEGETLRDALERAVWTPVRSPREAIRVKQGVLWVHARVRASAELASGAGWRVSFHHPRPVLLTSYVPRGGMLVELKGGLEQPLGEREVPSTSVVIPFEPRPGVVEDLYFRLETAPLGFAAHLSSREQWTRDELKGERLLGLYYGLALGLFLYNAFLAFTLRDKTYRWYLLVLLSNVLFFAARNGYIWAFGWTPSSLGGNGLITIQIIATINFTRHLLEIPGALPRYDRLMRATLLSAHVMFVVMLSWPTTVAETLMSPMSGLSVLICLVAGAIRLGQGNKEARYFMLAWLIFLVGGVMYALKFTGLIPHTPFTEHSLQVGSAIEMVLLSLALADRIRSLQAESTTRAYELERVQLTHARDLIALREESARRVIEAQDEHNRVLASDLHDSVGHRFLMIMREAQESAQGEGELDVGLARREALLNISALAEEGILETRELAHGLYPQRLLDLGLESALTSAAEGLERLGLRVHISVRPELSDRLTPGARLMVLRVAEEALQNALRHAACAQIWLTWALEGEMAALAIEDDGVGISECAVGEGLGLRTMRDRATQVGGGVEVGLRVEGGTRVCLRVPLEGGV